MINQQLSTGNYFYDLPCEIVNHIHYQNELKIKELNEKISSHVFRMTDVHKDIRMIQHSYLIHCDNGELIEKFEGCDYHLIMFMKLNNINPPYVRLGSSWLKTYH